jgi:hypothetical protein
MSESPTKHYGAAGVGCADHVSVEIDEALDDPDDLQMCVSTRAWSFRFSLSSRAHAPQMLAFLRKQNRTVTFSEFVVGSFLGAPVLVVKDDEFADRFWLRAFGSGKSVEFVLAADDLARFIDAVAEAVEDLES